MSWLARHSIVNVPCRSMSRFLGGFLGLRRYKKTSYLAVGLPCLIVGYLGQLVTLALTVGRLSLSRVEARLPK